MSISILQKKRNRFLNYRLLFELKPDFLKKLLRGLIFKFSEINHNIKSKVNFIKFLTRKLK